MAVRDPYFWKRFSVAVHASEAEEAAQAAAKAEAEGVDAESGEKKKSRPKSVFPVRGKVERTPSWLERQRAKRARRTLICWLFWFLFAGLIGVVVAVLLVLRGQGFIN